MAQPRKMRRTLRLLTKDFWACRAMLRHNRRTVLRGLTHADAAGVFAEVNIEHPGVLVFHLTSAPAWLQQWDAPAADGC
ncbi:MAG: hypothetical protein JJT96_05560 [Opitutales bacterium]|nr:hypothetical protein [Opitutales bacterium]